MPSVPEFALSERCGTFGARPCPAPGPLSLHCKSDPRSRNNVTEGTKQRIDVCAASELPSGEMKLIDGPDGAKIGVFNCGGTLYAIEDRCSHDDGPLAEGPFDADACTVECPRHGSLFDLTTGRPKTLPAYQPVTTYPVTIEDDTVKLEVA
jgi:3-phenylpropionate/trans-cinnamate dioxygenase ferredoxin component